MHVRWKSLWSLVKTAVDGFSADRATSMGAALAYYTLFSIVPLLLLILTVVGIFYEASAARGEIIQQLGGLLGRDSASAIEGMLQTAGQPGKGPLAGIISLITLIVGATGVLSELQSDLDQVFKAPEKARPSGLWGLLRSRLLSLGLVLGIAFLLVVSLALSAGLAVLGKWWGPMFGAWTTVLQVVNFLVDFGVITVVIAIIYKWMPSVRMRWRDVWRGALVTAFLLAIGKLLIGLYIGKTAVASAFGAAGSLIIMLIWVYYSTQIFLLGAEFTAEFTRRYGARAAQRSMGVPERERRSRRTPVFGPHPAPIPINPSRPSR